MIALGESRSDGDGGHDVRDEVCVTPDTHQECSGELIDIGVEHLSCFHLVVHERYFCRRPQFRIVEEHYQVLKEFRKFEWGGGTIGAPESL